MKVVHINAVGKSGGAGIAAFRHCEAMQRAGIDSQMLVLSRETKQYPFLKGIFKNDIIGWLYHKLSSHFMSALLKPFHPFAVFSYPFLTVNVAKHPLLEEADIIYLHWVAGSMLATKEIERILKLGKPVRWYMHDMNPITGGCHYSLECSQYRTGCINCPFIRKSLGINLAKRQYNNRIKRWKKYSNLEAYTPSYWLGGLVKKSSLWEGHKVVVFPNVFDTSLFHPCDKQFARDIMSIKSDRKVILFGAVGVDSPYKGWSYIRDALNELDPNRYEALIFGDFQNQAVKQLNIPCHFTGHLHDEYSLILAYNAADVFVSSSLADNYPNVVMEAMSCGLPCVGFKVGGLQDQIEHKKNGFLADYKNSSSLADGIRYVCEASDDDYRLMQMNARNFVTKVASYDVYQNISW